MAKTKPKSAVKPIDWDEEEAAELEEAKTAVQPKEAKTAAPLPDVRQKFADARAAMNKALLEREDEVDLVLTALLAQENPLFVGPPGSAKSLMLDSLMSWVQPARKFSVLFNKYTAPEEVFGPVSLAGLKAGTYERVGAGRLQEAELAFGDEIFKASSAILNTTLRIMNERVIEDGKGGWKKCPLLMLVAGSNEWPDGQELGALFDRFLIRKRVSYIRQERNVEALCWGGRSARVPKFTTTVTPQEVLAAHEECKRVKFPPRTREVFARIRKQLNGEGIRFSDRRLLKSVFVCQCFAWLNGSDEVLPEHLTVLSHVLWEDPTEAPDKCEKVVLRNAVPGKAEANDLRQQAQEAVQKLTPTQAWTKLEEIQLKLNSMGNASWVLDAQEELSQLMTDCAQRMSPATR